MVWRYNICNPSTWESEIGKSQVLGQHELQSKILPTPQKDKGKQGREGERIKISSTQLFSH